MNLRHINNSYHSNAGILFKIPALFFVLLLFSSLAKAGNLYWIGGSGNWSDINHWSLTSGNAGGSLSPGIPQSGDHVIFDANSGFTLDGKTVTINQTSVCNTITVSGIAISPIFDGGTLEIKGGAYYQTGTTLNNQIYFTSSATGNVIAFNGGVTGSANFYFNGSGSWLISGTLINTGRIYFTKGALDFGSSTITSGIFGESGCCGSVPFSVTEPRSLHLRTSTITLTSRNSQGSGSWVYSGTNLNAGTSQINISQATDDGYGAEFYGKSGHIYYNLAFTSTAIPMGYNRPSITQGNMTFNKVTFASWGAIATSNVINQLVLANGGKYQMADQTINFITDNTPDCQSKWELSGYGTASILTSPNPIIVTNAAITKIKTSGPGQFLANNSVDMGGNIGWVFSTSSKNLYWIGGGGNWTDPLHWTTNSDGTPISGGCLPTRNDNVFFNQFSGVISSVSPVIVNTTTAECNNITWNGVAGIPAFKSAGASNTLNIYGSSVWQSSMRYQIAATHYRSSTIGNTLTSNGVTIQGNTHFSGSGGWILTDEFSSPANDLNLTSGNLNTNDQALTLKNFGPIDKGTGGRTLTLGNSVITVNGNWAYISYGGPPITLNVGKSQINLTSGGANFYYDSGLTYYDLTFSNGAGLSTLTSLPYSTTTPCTFNTLTFAGSGSINPAGSPTPLNIRTLTLAASKKFVLGTNMEVRLEKLLISGPACSGLLEISSYLSGTRAKLNLIHPTTVTNAKITDINASGSPLNVTGGLDGGNNLNVSISPVSARNFYWIGGSGNWSDPAHWSLNADGTSGIGSGCLPGSIDNVFFNRYSGINYTVNLDIPAHCNNMSWEEVDGNTPVLKGLLENPLNIGGSLFLQTGMDFDVERVNFIGTNSGNTITTHGTKLYYSAANTSNKGIFFNNASGKWLLSDTFNVKNFGVINGTFDTGSQTINADNYESEYDPSGVNPILILGSSTLNISGYWDGGSIKKLDAGTSTINLKGTMPASNSSGGGVNSNEFRSAPGLIYSDLHFKNTAVPAKIIGYDTSAGNTFNTVTFAGESSINGSNAFNSLTLGENKNTHLMAGSTQTVNQLISNSSCGSWYFDNNCMSSGTACSATQKAVIKSTSDINLNHVRISGVTVTGGANYKAAGVDMGNNTGWIFSTPTSQNLYWIGGSGNWTDPAHWSTNSDGTSSGGSCAPTRFDNVFFNQYSGESPIINTTGYAEFHDMTWEGVKGSPTVGGTLHCYGSMTLQSSLSHNGGIDFLSDEVGETITTNGAVAANNYDVNFSASGSYTFTDDFTANSRINFLKGTLNTNGKTVTALSFNGASASEPLSLILGASHIYLSYGSEGWSYTGALLDAGTSHIYLSGSANYFKGKDGAVYHSITFDGIANQSNFLYGAISVNELIFVSKNSTYQIEAEKTVTVEKTLQMSGTNCATVQLQSTVAGRQASICLKEGNATFNFVSIQDIEAVCTPFIMLPQSTNAGNNKGIIFQPNPGTGIGVLGPDITLCSNKFPIILDGSPFMPDMNSKIQWSNANTGEMLGTEITQAITTGGTYRIRVEYGENCSVTDDIVIISNPIAGTEDIIAPDVNNCSGKESMVLTAALSPSSTIINPVFTWYDDASKYNTLGTGAAFQVSAVTKRSYWVTVKGDNTCESSVKEVEVTFENLSKPTVTVSQPTCTHATGSIDITPKEGFTYSFNGNRYAADTHFDLASGTYSITARNTEGCTSEPIRITINAQPPIPTATIYYGKDEFQTIGNIEVTHSGQTGGVYTASPLGLIIDAATGTIDLAHSLPNQLYRVTYSFTNGLCSSTANTSVKINSTPAAIAYPLLDYCAVGTVNITQTGPKGGKYTASSSALKIDALTGNIDLSRSLQGHYTITYTYQDGSIESKTTTIITINALPAVTITNSTGTVISKGQTTALTATGGISYAWIGPDIMSGQNTATIHIKPSVTATYTAIVTNSSGCSEAMDVIIEVTEIRALLPNNVITPNGDGKNDTWIIRNIEQYPGNKVSVYDRAGRLVYSKTGYANNWDGTWNGKQLNEDAYIYVIDMGNGLGIIRGTISIISDHP
jgi:gliding motility-associated-like protein